ncbi:MAG: HDIG domain-containing metalloprotein [Candidatus Spyradosoma sp.]
MAHISKRKRREEGALIYRVFQEPRVPLRERFRRLLAGTWLLLVFGALLSLVAFFGRPPRAPVVYEGYVPNYSFAAPFSFSYASTLLRNEREENARLQVNPVYALKLDSQEAALSGLERVFERVAADFPHLKRLRVRTTRDAAIAEIVAETCAAGEPGKGAAALAHETARQDLALGVSRLVEYCDDATRFRELADAAKSVFWMLAKEGIFEDAHEGAKKFSRPLGRARFGDEAGCTEREAEGVFSERFRTVLWQRVFTKEMRGNLGKVAEEVGYVFQTAGLFRANMFFDREATLKQKNLAAQNVGESVVKVHAGDPLLSERVPVSAEMLERWRAYRAAEEKRSDGLFEERLPFLSNTFYAYCILASAAIFGILLTPDVFRERRRRLALAGTLILANAALVRLMLGVVESPRFEEIFAQTQNIQVWLSAPTCTAILSALMLGTPLAVVTSLAAASISSLMLGGSAESLLAASVAVMTSVYIVRDARKRSVLLRAGFYSGVATALASLLVGFHESFVWESFAANFVAAVAAGSLSGIAAAGVLSIFEGIFKITTNITLLELADYDHPLLRRLQVVAPGTFLHSVMVADFAAKAAQAAGANPVLCRCAALFHDVGKTLKPEYFTENKKEGMPSPHDRQTPRMSALIIRSHVREGVALAEEYHLPEAVRDLILQHHGRGLAGFFFEKAKKLAVAAAEETGEDPAFVDDADYRYDGPRPQTVEAAVLMLCDVVEASARSIKKFSRQAVEDVVQRRIAERVAEGEFNDCPITLKQLDAVRRSLVDSVFTSRHERISYNTDESGDAAEKKPAAEPRARVLDSAALAAVLPSNGEAPAEEKAPSAEEEKKASEEQS